MSDLRGTESFESPDKDYLEEYLSQSHKSLIRMKNGKSPLVFKPRRKITRKIGVILLFVIILPISYIVSQNQTIIPISHPSDDSNQTITSFTTTPYPIPTLNQSEKNLEDTVIQVEDVINRMLGTNITPVMVNGTINTSSLISLEDYLDLIWYLSQFEEDTIWWDLGRELLIKDNSYWNTTFLGSMSNYFRLKTLRTLLSYSENALGLSTANYELYKNVSTFLWNTTLVEIDNTTGMISINSSLLYSYDHIIFLEVLTRAIYFTNIFQTETVLDLVIKLLRTFERLTGINNGIPTTFFFNLSWISQIYYFKEHAELLIGLDNLNQVIENENITIIKNRVDTYISNYFINKDWSCPSSFNLSSMIASKDVFATDQALLIRVNVLFERLNFANYTAITLIEDFSANKGFYSTVTNNQTQYLIDQVLILLAFQELILLENKLLSTDTVPHGPAASSWGIEVIILSLILILLHRNINRKRKYLSKASRKEKEG